MQKLRKRPVRPQGWATPPVISRAIVRAITRAASSVTIRAISRDKPRATTCATSRARTRDTSRTTTPAAILVKTPALTRAKSRVTARVTTSAKSQVTSRVTSPVKSRATSYSTVPVTSRATLAAWRRCWQAVGCRLHDGMVKDAPFRRRYEGRYLVPDFPWTIGLGPCFFRWLPSESCPWSAVTASARLSMSRV